MADVAEESPETKPTQSNPIAIPSLKRDRHHHVPTKDETSPLSKGAFVHSYHSNDDLRLPDGSPSFAVVMNELSSSLTRTTIRQEIEIPLSPLALSDDAHQPEMFTSDNDIPEKQSPEEVESPQTTTKKLDPSHMTPRDRSHSWNYRNKMAAERRKQMHLAIPQHLQTNSAHSSPVTVRKPKKTTSQPGNPQMIHILPKFKILNENISVSHDDLIKEQERERQLADEFHEAKSIFDAPKFDRLGATPE